MSRFIPEELIRIKAEKIWKKRQSEGKDGTPDDDWEAAKEYYEKHWWEVFLWRLNQPFIWVEKKVVEPLDFWADRANIFSFFSKISPIIEALGVLAIPIVIFYFEVLREEKQLRIEENLISTQTEVRHQQAVRDYLSQITTVYLETEQGNELKNNEELKTLLEATTIALFNELSVSESFSAQRTTKEIIERDRKGQVVRFLSGLGWIHGSGRERPRLSLQGANLRNANLSDADLSDADLSDANLSDANLRNADLSDANLSDADLSDANLSVVIFQEAQLIRAILKDAILSSVNFYRANLRNANLSNADLAGVLLSDANLSNADLSNADLASANLTGANLRNADLASANLTGANLKDVRRLTSQQIKSSCYWDKVIYKGEWDQKQSDNNIYTWVPENEQAKQANKNYIEDLRQDTASDPEKPPDCSRWENEN